MTDSGGPENIVALRALEAEERNRRRGRLGQEVGAADGRPLTDLGNAERLVERHGADLRFCHPLARWFVWDGRLWVEDTSGEVARRAAETVRELYPLLAKVEGLQARSELARHAARSESEQRLRAMVALATNVRPVPVAADALDADPWLLNAENGIVDLRTGALQPHSREHLLTRMAGAEYDPEASCPRWEAFLARTFSGQAELVEFVQRAFGLALIGKVIEHVLFILYGQGANGKSTLMNAILGVLGDYGKQAPASLLLAHRDDPHPTATAALRGARLAVCTEVESGRRLDEATVKQLTGGDRRVARFMRHDFFEYSPSDTLVLLTNHRPVLRDNGRAIWRRIRLVPFDNVIPAEEQDPRLGDLLRTESPGILAWLVRGCLAYLRHGLGMPDQVRTATESYRADMDIVAAFLDDATVSDPRGWTATAALWAAYQAWAAANGDRPVSKRRLCEALTEHGFTPERGADRAQARGWRGLLLRSGADTTDTADGVSHYPPYARA